MSEDAYDDKVRCIINIDKFKVFIIFKNKNEGKKTKIPTVINLCKEHMTRTQFFVSKEIITQKL